MVKNVPTAAREKWGWLPEVLRGRLKVECNCTSGVWTWWLASNRTFLMQAGLLLYISSNKRDLYVTIVSNVTIISAFINISIVIVSVLFVILQKKKYSLVLSPIGSWWCLLEHILWFDLVSQVALEVLSLSLARWKLLNQMRKSLHS